MCNLHKISTFTILCGDQNGITDHMKTKRNKSAEEASASTSKTTIQYVQLQTVHLTYHSADITFHLNQMTLPN